MARLVAVVGATATGKSDLALELAERLGGEILSADALQAYRGFDVGTAKPTAVEQGRVRHHLLDILAPHQPYSAGEFARRANPVVEDILGRGRTAFLVGGSGLYLRALLEGISPLPPADRGLRAEFGETVRRLGLAGLRRELEMVDPESARRIAPRDAQRTVRALEVARLSGRPLSAWLAERPFGPGRLRALKFGLTLPRSILYDRIAERVRRMLREGWVEEVAGLLRRGLAPELPAFQAIGYRQLARHLRGEWTLERATDEVIRATRRLAKRQETWFRREGDVHWLNSPSRRARVREILDLLPRGHPGEG